MSQLAFAALALVVTACSPACTPPEARNPDGTDEKLEAAEGDGAKTDQGHAVVPSGSGDVITTAKGVDLSRLSESQRTTFFQILNTEPSACDKPHSLAVSLRDDDSCRDSLVAAQFVADRLAQGASPTQVKDALEYVVQSLKPREIEIGDSPVYGNERAPVVVVVFADFECPHCKAEAPVLRRAIDQFRGRAKLVFKHYPLSGHKRARVAAHATVAAQEQGKFWPMHDLVFANQDALSDEDLLQYAAQIGLDLDKFRAAFDSQAAKDRVEADRRLGEALDIQGTPAVYVDGRYVNELLFGGTVTGWIDDALKR